MTGPTQWWKYGPCERCGADAERPCRETRSRSSPGHPISRPHRGRHVKWWLPRRPEEATR